MLKLRLLVWIIQNRYLKISQWKSSQLLDRKLISKMSSESALKIRKMMRKTQMALGISTGEGCLLKNSWNTTTTSSLFSQLRTCVTFLTCALCLNSDFRYSTSRMIMLEVQTSTWSGTTTTDLTGPSNRWARSSASILKKMQKPLSPELRAAGSVFGT